MLQNRPCSLTKLVIIIILFSLLSGFSLKQPTYTPTPVTPTATSTPLTYEPSSIIHGSEPVQSPAVNPPDFANDTTSHELGAFDLVSANACYGLYRMEVGPSLFKDESDFITKMESFMNDHMKKNPNITLMRASKDGVVDSGIKRDNGDGTFSMILSFKADGAVAYPEPGYFDPRTTQEWVTLPGEPELSIGDDKHTYMGINGSNGETASWLKTVGANRDNIDQQLVKVTTADSAPAAGEPAPATAGMPEGWTSIAETREIGGRQVVLNEKGEAATEIDGEWYPVDAKGCYYEELLSPEVQNDPKVVEKYNKLMSEKSFSNLDANGLQRYLGSTSVALVSDGSEKMYENKFDSQIINQKLCYQAGVWYHVVDQVMAVDKDYALNDSSMVRAVVGWLENGQYKTFTYLEKTSERVKGNLDLTNASIRKAQDLSSAFSLWNEVIAANKQVEVRFPYGVTEGDYINYVTKLVEAAHNTVPKYWSASIEDDVFKDWAKKIDSQESFFSNRANKNHLFIDNRNCIWKTWMSGVIKGSMPIPHIRTITTEK